MTRRASPQSPPVCLSIAGSDSGGGAGIQADLKAMEAAGAFGTSAITAVTAQHTRGVERSHVLPLDLIEAQIDAVRSDMDVRAVKTGMLGTAPVVDLVTESFADWGRPLVVDPVMIAATGDRLLEREAEQAYRDLIEVADLVTPNVDEAEVLTEESIQDVPDAIAAGEALVDQGAGAALVKGGHLETDDVTDVLVTEETTRELRHARVDTDSTHGSGCTLASAIAARLAHGDDLVDAVAAGLDLIDRAVRYPVDVGEGPGAVHHLASLRDAGARAEVHEEVHALVDALTTADVSPLVPEVGMNVVGVTPYGEGRGDTAAVDGRITRTTNGIRANAGVAFGASSHVARFLLEIREHDPAIRFGINCRFDDRIEAALTALDVEVAEYARADEPDEHREREGSTMQWAAVDLMDGRDVAPGAVIDRGAHGKEPILKLLGADAATVRDRALALADAVSTQA